MEKKINIVGGSSWNKRVTIYSDDFVANSHCSYEKESNTTIINCVVEKRSKLVRVLRKNQAWFIPKIFNLFASLWQGSPLMGKVFWVLWLANVLFNNHAPLTGSSNVFLDFILPAIFMVAFLVLIRIYIAPWHAAEHMAIACYEKNGSPDVSEIEKESPIHRRCGGRLIFPFLLCFILCSYLRYYQHVGLNLNLLSLISLEIILRIDSLIGFDRIPVFSQMSVLLQKYVTTRKPGEEELATAAAAIQGLIEAQETAER